MLCPTLRGLRRRSLDRSVRSQTIVRIDLIMILSKPRMLQNLPWEQAHLRSGTSFIPLRQNSPTRMYRTSGER